MYANFFEKFGIIDSGTDISALIFYLNVVFKKAQLKLVQ